MCRQNAEESTTNYGTLLKKMSFFSVFAKSGSKNHIYFYNSRTLIRVTLNLDLMESVGGFQYCY